MARRRGGRGRVRRPAGGREGEQKHFEQAIGQLERFVEDKILVCRRERASLAEKLRAARARRDEVVGSTARERVEAEIARLAEQGRGARTAYRRAGVQGRRGLPEMARRIPRASVSAADRDAAVPGGVPDRAAGAGDVVLRLLHTADWHLGRRFPSFPEEAQKKLSRARMDVVARILDVARRNSVHAVLCAGDLFDDPSPTPDFWEGLAKTFRDQPAPHAPVFLVPGNHDPLTAESVWAPRHPFRARLPAWVHVVDRDDFTYELTPDAVLYARPCRSKAGENDLAMALPAREPGDARIRIGCVHGCTFDMDGYQTNFPIRRDAGVQRGLNYLAIGDTHSFRDVTSDLPVPTVYPGRAGADELRRAGRGQRGARRAVPARARGRASTPSRWRSGGGSTCGAATSTSCAALLTTPDLDRHVVRLHLDMTVSLAEESEVERILRELQGTDATHGRAGVLLVDRTKLRLKPVRAEPSRTTCRRWSRTRSRGSIGFIADASDEAEKDTATRALAHLYKLLQGPGGARGARAMRLHRLRVTDFAGDRRGRTSSSARA